MTWKYFAIWGMFAAYLFYLMYKNRNNNGGTLA